MTSNIILSPSLKLFWNIRHSVMVLCSRTQSVYFSNNTFCSSVIAARSFSSFRQISSCNFLYSLQEEVSQSVGSILPKVFYICYLTLPPARVFPITKTPASISAIDIPSSSPDMKSLISEPPTAYESACSAIPITISITA